MGLCGGGKNVVSPSPLPKDGDMPMRRSKHNRKRQTLSDAAAAVSLSKSKPPVHATSNANIDSSFGPQLPAPGWKRPEVLSRHRQVGVADQSPERQYEEKRKRAQAALTSSKEDGETRDTHWNDYEEDFSTRNEDKWSRDMQELKEAGGSFFPARRGGPQRALSPYEQSRLQAAELSNSDRSNSGLPASLRNAAKDWNLRVSATDHNRQGTRESAMELIEKTAEKKIKQGGEDTEFQKTKFGGLSKGLLKGRRLDNSTPKVDKNQPGDMVVTTDDLDSQNRRQKSNFFFFRAAKQFIGLDRAD